MVPPPPVPRDGFVTGTPPLLSPRARSRDPHPGRAPTGPGTRGFSRVPVDGVPGRRACSRAGRAMRTPNPLRCVGMRNLLVLLAVCALTTPLAAEIGPPVDLATRARGAGKVVVARVVDVQSTFGTNAFWRSPDHLDRLAGRRGDAEGGARAGGDADPRRGHRGDLTLRVSDLPSVQVGERAVTIRRAYAARRERSASARASGS